MGHDVESLGVFSRDAIWQDKARRFGAWQEFLRSISMFCLGKKYCQFFPAMARNLHILARNRYDLARNYRFGREFVVFGKTRLALARKNLTLFLARTSHRENLWFFSCRDLYHPRYLKIRRGLVPTKGPKPFLFDKIKLLTVSENFFRWLLSKLESDYKRSRFSGSDRDFPAGLRNRNKWDEEVSASDENRMFRRSDLATKRNFSALSQFFQEENFLMVKSCSGSVWRGSWGW